MTRRIPRFLRAISLALVVTFIFQDVGFAAPHLNLFGRTVSEENHRSWAKDFLPTIPESVASVETAWKSSDPKHTIILIQDAHTNDSAQFNLAKALDLILAHQAKQGSSSESKAFDITMFPVFVEGGFGDDSLSFLRKTASLSHRKQVAKSYLRQGLLHGEEYLDLTSQHDFKIWGIEDRALYQKSLETYRVVASERGKFEIHLNQIQNTLNVLKLRILNPWLLSFDQTREKYLKEQLSLTDYLARMMLQAKIRNISLKNYPNLHKLRKLKKLEARLEAHQVSERHKNAILKRLLRSSKFLNFDALLNEQRSLETEIYGKLTQSEDEAGLLRCAEALRFLKKLLQFGLTPEEFKQFRSLKESDPAHLTGFLNKKIMDRGEFYEDAVFHDAEFKVVVGRAVEFYELTLRRDQEFVVNALSKMGERDVKNAVLIAGGYHSENLKSLLKSKNISYISLRPQVLKETNQKRYEQILLGQKLSTATPSATMSSRMQRPASLAETAMLSAVAARLAQVSKIAVPPTSEKIMGFASSKDIFNYSLPKSGDFIVVPAANRQSFLKELMIERMGAAVRLLSRSPKIKFNPDNIMFIFSPDGTVRFSDKTLRAAARLAVRSQAEPKVVITPSERAEINKTVDQTKLYRQLLEWSKKLGRHPSGARLADQGAGRSNRREFLQWAAKFTAGIVVLGSGACGGSGQRAGRALFTGPFPLGRGIEALGVGALAPANLRQEIALTRSLATSIPSGGFLNVILVSLANSSIRISQLIPKNAIIGSPYRDAAFVLYRSFHGNGEPLEFAVLDLLNNRNVSVRNAPNIQSIPYGNSYPNNAYGVHYQVVDARGRVGQEFAAEDIYQAGRVLDTFIDELSADPTLQSPSSGFVVSANKIDDSKFEISFDPQMVLSTRNINGIAQYVLIFSQNDTRWSLRISNPDFLANRVNRVIQPPTFNPFIIDLKAVGLTQEGDGTSTLGDFRIFVRQEMGVQFSSETDTGIVLHGMDFGARLAKRAEDTHPNGVYETKNIFDAKSIADAKDLAVKIIAPYLHEIKGGVWAIKLRDINYGSLVKKIGDARDPIEAIDRLHTLEDVDHLLLSAMMGVLLRRGNYGHDDNEAKHFYYDNGNKVWVDLFRPVKAGYMELLEFVRSGRPANDPTRSGGARLAYRGSLNDEEEAPKKRSFIQKWSLPLAGLISSGVLGLMIWTELKPLFFRITPGANSINGAEKTLKVAGRVFRFPANTDFEACKKIIFETIELLKEKGIGDKLELESFAQGIRAAQVLPGHLDFIIFKSIDQNGRPIIYINPEKFSERIRTGLSDQNAFAEQIACVVARESAGFTLLKKNDVELNSVASKFEAINTVFSVFEEKEEDPFVDARVTDGVNELTALLLFGETYEAMHQYEALKKMQSLGLYDPKAVRPLSQAEQEDKEEIDELYSTGGDIEKLIQLELPKFMNIAVVGFLQGTPARSANDQIYRLFAAQEMWLFADRKDGVDGNDVLRKANSKSREIWKGEYYKASASHLLPKIQDLWGKAGGARLAEGVVGVKGRKPFTFEIPAAEDGAMRILVTPVRVEGGNLIASFSFSPLNIRDNPTFDFVIPEGETDKEIRLRLNQELAGMAYIALFDGSLTILNLSRILKKIRSVYPEHNLVGARLADYEKTFKAKWDTSAGSQPSELLMGLKNDVHRLMGGVLAKVEMSTQSVKVTLIESSQPVASIVHGLFESAIEIIGKFEAQRKESGRIYAVEDVVTKSAWQALLGRLKALHDRSPSAARLAQVDVPKRFRLATSQEIKKILAQRTKRVLVYTSCESISDSMLRLGDSKIYPSADALLKASLAPEGSQERINLSGIISDGRMYLLATKSSNPSEEMDMRTAWQKVLEDPTKQDPSDAARLADPAESRLFYLSTLRAGQAASRDYAREMGNEDLAKAKQEAINKTGEEIAKATPSFKQDSPSAARLAESDLVPSSDAKRENLLIERGLLMQLVDGDMASGIDSGATHRVREIDEELERMSAPLGKTEGDYGVGAADSEGHVSPDLAEPFFNEPFNNSAKAVSEASGARLAESAKGRVTIRGEARFLSVADSADETTMEHALDFVVNKSDSQPDKEGWVVQKVSIKNLLQSTDTVVLEIRTTETVPAAALFQKIKETLTVSPILLVYDVENGVMINRPDHVLDLIRSLDKNNQVFDGARLSKLPDGLEPMVVALSKTQKLDGTQISITFDDKTPSIAKFMRVDDKQVRVDVAGFYSQNILLQESGDNTQSSSKFKVADLVLVLKQVSARYERDAAKKFSPAPEEHYFYLADYNGLPIEVQQTTLYSDLSSALKLSAAKIHIVGTGAEANLVQIAEMVQGSLGVPEGLFDYTDTPSDISAAQVHKMSRDTFRKLQELGVKFEEKARLVITEDYLTKDGRANVFAPLVVTTLMKKVAAIQALGPDDAGFEEAFDFFTRLIADSRRGGEGPLVTPNRDDFIAFLQGKSKLAVPPALPSLSINAAARLAEMTARNAGWSA